MRVTIPFTTNPSAMKRCKLAAGVVAASLSMGALADLGPNLAIGAGSDGSSKSNGTSYGDVRDGNASSYWQPSGTSGQRVAIKWSGDKTFNTVVIREISNSVTAWRLVNHDSGEQIAAGTTLGATAQISFAPVTMDKVSLYLDSATSSIRIAEFEVYNASNTSSSSSSSSVSSSSSSSSSSSVSSSVSSSSSSSSTPNSSSSSSVSSSSSSSSPSTGGNSSITIQEYDTGFCGVDGTVDSNNAGYTGSGFANTANVNGMAVDYKVKVPYSGNYIVELRYASASNRPADVVVNGNVVGSISFPTTGGWTSWTIDSANIALDGGDNTISIVATGGDGLANIDSLTVIGNDPAAADCSAGSADGPLLSQDGNPVHDRFNRAKTKWSQSQNQADIILSHQYNNGGWPKNQAYDSSGSGGNGSGTFDNGATVTEIVYLAQVYQNTGANKYRDAVRKAMDFILDAQYSTGAWPQFYPLRGGYSDHATYNDNAMANILTVLHHARQQNAPFDSGIFSDNDRAEMQQAINRGVDYILRSQWKQNGNLTVWCAQHGAFDYQPKKARAYELESLSGSESVEIIGFLMTQPQTPAIETAVKAAVNWFRSPNTYLANHTYDKNTEEKIIYQQGSTMWYRFYDLNTNRGFFSDRDGSKFYDIMEMSEERREGYSWGGNYGSKIISYANSVGY